jgi:hypothetical protein
MTDPLGWRQVADKLDGLETKRPNLFTINGTGTPDPTGFGFSGDTGRGVDPAIWNWIGIWYPAATFPMGPSVQTGRANMVAAIQANPGPFAISGYSQGALVTDFVWRDDILSPSGVLHDRLSDCVGIVNYGDPMRCPGICNGNVVAGFPIPAPVDGTPSGGISGDADLTAAQTPSFLMSCNNDGDLYGAAPSGPGAGADEELIFNIVQNFNINNIGAIAIAILPLLNPEADVAAIVAELPALLIGLIAGGQTSLPSNASNAQIVGFLEALLNGGLFVVSGFGPHGDYGKMVGAMCNWLNDVGLQYT